MAQFILATKTEDQVERNARMAEILKYNEEEQLHPALQSVRIL